MGMTGSDWTLLKGFARPNNNNFFEWWWPIVFSGNGMPRVRLGREKSEIITAAAASFIFVLFYFILFLFFCI